MLPSAGRWRDFDEVLPFDHGRAPVCAQLAGHCRDAVCFLTRQLAMLVRRVVLRRTGAITAKVMAASGMWLQSSSIASGPGARRISTVGAAGTTQRPWLEPASMKRMSPLDRSGTHAFHTHGLVDAGKGASGDEVRGRRGTAST